ncbi:MAG: sugar phosphate isomerase/epimerase [Clostridia bacterium]|nr:sugar phosphate isomerase/epimerase [Clostridia bacterium]
MSEFAIQLWSFKEMEADNLMGCIEAAAKIGYTGIETAGLFGHSAAAIREKCDALGLTIISTHTGLAFLTPEAIAETIENHKTFGCTNLTIPNSKLPDREQRAAIIETINRVTPILADAGITLHYHNHSPEFLFEDPFELYDELAEKTNLKFQIDVYHTFAAGIDPIAVIERYKDRVSLLHLRDGMGYKLDPKALGEGKCPVRECVAYAKANGLQMIVENASWKPDCISEAAKCYDYLTRCAE